MKVTIMVTIAISKETRRKLLEIASELQKNSEKKLDFEDVIEYLITLHEHKMKKPELFEAFCRPIEKVSFEEIYGELIKERRRDEELQERYSLLF